MASSWHSSNEFVICWLSSSIHLSLCVQGLSLVCIVSLIATVPCLVFACPSIVVPPSPLPRAGYVHKCKLVMEVSLLQNYDSSRLLFYVRRAEKVVPASLS